jgi:hypothetical protein
MKLWTTEPALIPGAVVRIRSRDEIARTLDPRGTLDGLHFMPEMFRYCGRKFKVVKHPRTIFVEGKGVRCIKDTVILDKTTCNGEAHHGCQRQCVVLWKKAWLAPAHESDKHSITAPRKGIALDRISDRVMPCQSAELYKATSRHIASTEDFVQVYVCDARFRKWLPLKQICTLLTWLIIKVKMMRKQSREKALHGKAMRTPVISLTLRPGEIVRIKDIEEVRLTLDREGKNRGLAFTPEMVKYCGTKARVDKSVNRIIDEASGRMQRITNTVILKDVTCDGSRHAGCPRRCLLLWREIWLERAKDVPPDTP